MTKTIAALLGALLLTWNAAAPAQTQGEQEFIEGRHYEALPTPVELADPDRQEVVEVFSYGCIHCYNFKPAIESWREELGDDVNFLRLPAIFDQSWVPLAQAYYTADALDVVDEVHGPLFEAIHDRNIDISDPDRLATLFANEAGIDEEEFLRVFESAGVDTRVRQAEARARMYRVRGTPTMVVNGRYRIDGSMAGSNDAMLDVVDFLLEQERADGNGDDAQAARR